MAKETKATTEPELETALASAESLKTGLTKEDLIEALDNKESNYQLCMAIIMAGMLSNSSNRLSDEALHDRAQTLTSMIYHL